MNISDESMKKPRVIRVTVNLPTEAVVAMKALAAQRGTTMTEVLRSAIYTEKFISDKCISGAKILIEEKDHSVTQMVPWYE